MTVSASQAMASQAMASEPVELTDDPAFARRIIRLTIVSSVALGLVWMLAKATLDVSPSVRASLALGWLMMPSILLLSLRWPRLRYALAIPSMLVGVPLLIICATGLPDGQTARTGWLMLTAGIMTGGILGVWFWFRWVPVPSVFHEPFSLERWGLIGIHVLLVVAGLFLVVLANL